MILDWDCMIVRRNIKESDIVIEGNVMISVSNGMSVNDMSVISGLWLTVSTYKVNR